MKPHEGSAEQYARTIEAVYQSLAQLDMPAINNITALVELIEARESALRAALADERKHADELAAALEALRYDETNCWCSSLCDVPRQCGCARRLLKSHAARRAKEAAE